MNKKLRTDVSCPKLPKMEGVSKGKKITSLVIFLIQKSKKKKIQRLNCKRKQYELIQSEIVFHAIAIIEIIDIISPISGREL